MITRPVAALDLVWCHFPLVEFPDRPGPKPRPALVRQVLDLDGVTYIEVVYGTSQATSYSMNDLYIANCTDLIECQLPQATIFHLDRVVTLPWVEEWFASRDDDTGPVIGHINARIQGYLRELTKRG